MLSLYNIIYLDKGMELIGGLIDSGKKESWGTVYQV